MPQGGGVLDPAANLKICDFDGAAFMNKATGTGGKANGKPPKDPEKEKEPKRASSLQAFRVLRVRLLPSGSICFVAQVLPETPLSKAQAQLSKILKNVNECRRRDLPVFVGCPFRS